jgi:hypothetical protein
MADQREKEERERERERERRQRETERDRRNGFPGTVICLLNRVSPNFILFWTTIPRTQPTLTEKFQISGILKT